MRCSHNCQQCACTASNAHVRLQVIEYLNISGLVIDLAIAMRTAVPIDLYCYADIDYTVIAVCCNVLYKTHLIAYDGY